MREGRGRRGIRLLGLLGATIIQSPCFRFALPACSQVYNKESVIQHTLNQSLPVPFLLSQFSKVHNNVQTPYASTQRFQ